MKLTRERIRIISEKLQKRKKESGQSDIQQAKSLGLSLPTYQAAKNGTMPEWLADYLAEKLGIIFEEK